MSCVMHRKVASFPALAGRKEQRASPSPLQTAKRLVQNDQAGSAAADSARQPHPLTFTAREQRSVRSDGRLQSHRQARQDFIQLRGLDGIAERLALTFHAVAQILEQGPIPQLNGRIDPNGVPAQPSQFSGRQRLAIDEDLPGVRSIPTQQKAHQARLARPGNTDDGNVLARTDGKTRHPEDLIARLLDRDRVERQRRRRRSSPLRVRHEIGVLVGSTLFGTEGLEQPQRDVAMLGVLLDQERQLHAQHGHHEDPVHEQDRPARSLGAGEIVKHHGGSHSEADDPHDGLDHHAGSGHITGGTRPFTQARAVLCGDGALGGVCTNGRQTEQGIQVETSQPASMAPHAEILLEQDWLAGKWQSQHQERQHEHQRRRRWIEPDDPRHGRQQLAQTADQLSSVSGQEAQPMQQV